MRGTLAGSTDFEAANVAAPGTNGMVAAGDLNNDGRTDVVAEDLIGGVGPAWDFRVLLGDGTGGLSDAGAVPLGDPPSHAQGMKVADLNGDSALDVVLLSATTGGENHGTLRIVFGNANGSFSPPLLLDLAGGPGWGQGAATLSLLDLNGDSDLDIVVALREWRNVFDTQSKLAVLLSLGGGLYSEPLYNYSPVLGRMQPFCVAESDWNLDGHMDVAVGEHSATAAAPPRVTVFLGDGTGAFSDVRSFPLTVAPRRMLSADFTGDGRDDLAVLVAVGGVTPGTVVPHVVMLPGSSQTLFGDEITLVDSGATLDSNNALDSPVVGVAEDRDGDGSLDLVLLRSSTVAVMLGDGNGQLALSGEFDAGVHVNHGVFADMTSDGRQDAVLNSSQSLAIVVADSDTGFAAAPVFAARNGIVLTGDFTGDSFVDVGNVGWASSSNLQLAVFPGVGGGSFGSPIQTNGSSSPVTAAGTGDFDEDGNPDWILSLATTTTTDPAVLQVWSGTGAGSFMGPSSSLLAPFAARSMAIGDLDRDGHADVALAYADFATGSGSVGVARGDGAGRFGSLLNLSLFIATGAQESGPEMANVAVGDLDQNGSLDIVALGSDGATGYAVAVLLNDGVGGFGTPSRTELGGFCHGLLVLDFNSDGISDVAVGCLGGLQGHVGLLSGDGTGSLTLAADIALPAAELLPTSVRPGDFNADDVLDLFIGGNSRAGVADPSLAFVLEGDGSGGFRAPLTFGAVTTGNFGLADLNDDGRWDLVTAYGAFARLGLLVNTTTNENTPSGSNTLLRPIDPTRGGSQADITFANVVQGGVTRIQSSTFGPLPPTGFRLGTPAEYFDIFTTALFSGFIDICIDYNPLSYLNPADVRLFHYDNGVWNDTTTTNDSASGRICGQTLSLSLFALVEPIPGEPEEIVLTATKDAVIHRNEPNLNGGANRTLTVSDDTRVLVGFDLSGVDVSRVESARLVMTVGDVDGVGRGVLVDAHRLTQAWTEGNGRNGPRNDLGNGAGTTWSCPTDGNVANRTPNCAPRWSGGRFAAPTGDGVIHSRRTRGEVSWDVTADLLAGAGDGWLLKLRRDRSDARADYDARDAQASGPKLIIEYAR